MSPLSSKERARLRAECNRLVAAVHVGQHGATDAVVATLDDALRTRELVKVQLGRSTELPAKALAQELARASGSDVVQVIGRTATFYRHNPSIERSAGDTPPWR